jgi:hypothetical protein
MVSTLYCFIYSKRQLASSQQVPDTTFSSTLSVNQWMNSCRYLQLSRVLCRQLTPVLACAAIANVVKSSLGPVGLDKMLVDDIGVSWFNLCAMSLGALTSGCDGDK